MASRVRKPPSRQIPCRVMTKSVDNEEHSYVPNTENIRKFDGVTGCKITQKNKCMADYRYIYPMLDPDGKTRLVTERDFHKRIKHKYRNFEGYDYIYPVLTVGNHEGKRSDLIAAPKVDTTFVPEEVDRMIPLGVEQILTDYDDRSLLFIASKRGDIYPAATKPIPFKTLQVTGSGDEFKPNIKSVSTLNEEAEPKPTKKQLRDIDRWKKKMEELNSAGNNLSGNRIVHFGCEVNRAEWRDDEDIMSWFAENYPEDNEELANGENEDNLEDDQSGMESLVESSVDECDSGYEESLRNSHLLSRKSTESCNSEEMRYESPENIDGFQNRNNPFSAGINQEENTKYVYHLARLSTEENKDEPPGRVEHSQTDKSTDSCLTEKHVNSESKMSSENDISIQNQTSTVDTCISSADVENGNSNSECTNLTENVIVEDKRYPCILENSKSSADDFETSNKMKPKNTNGLYSVNDLYIKENFESTNFTDMSNSYDNTAENDYVIGIINNNSNVSTTSPVYAHFDQDNYVCIDDNFEPTNLKCDENFIENEDVIDINNVLDVSISSPDSCDGHVNRENEIDGNAFVASCDITKSRRSSDENFEPTNLKCDEHLVKNDEVNDINNVLDVSISSTDSCDGHVNRENKIDGNAFVASCDITKSRRSSDGNFEPTNLKCDENFVENDEVIDINNVLDVSISSTDSCDGHVNQENEIDSNAFAASFDITKSRRSCDDNANLVTSSIETEKPVVSSISKSDVCVTNSLEEHQQESLKNLNIQIENTLTDDYSELNESCIDSNTLHTQNENSTKCDINQENFNSDDEQKNHYRVKDCEVINCGINGGSKTHRTSESTVSSDMFFDSIEGNSGNSHHHSFDTCSDGFHTPDIKEEDDCVWSQSNLCDGVSKLLRPIAEPRDILDCSDESSFVEGLINRTEKDCAKSLKNSWEKLQIPLT